MLIIGICANLIMIFIVASLMASNYCKTNSQAARSWILVFFFNMLWNLTLLLRNQNYFTGKASDFVMAVVMFYTGIMILMAALYLLSDNIDRRVKNWLLAGFIFAPVYAFFANILFEGIFWKLMPSILIVSGSLIASGVLILKYYKWTSKQIMQKIGPILVIFVFFGQAIVSFVFLLALSSDNQQLVSISSVLGAVFKVIFAVGIGIFFL